MMKKVLFMKRLITILVILLLFAACEKDDKRTYFKTEGVGYVYYWHTKEPVQYAIVDVSYGFESRPFGQVQPGTDSFRADENGYFCVKFLRRTERSNVTGYSVTAFDTDYKLTNTAISFTVDNIKGKNILNLDTLWLRY